MDSYRIWLTARRYTSVQLRRVSFWLMIFLPFSVLLALPYFYGQVSRQISSKKIILLYEPQFEGQAHYLQNALQLRSSRIEVQADFQVELQSVTEDQRQQKRKELSAMVRRGQCSAFIELYPHPSSLQAHCALHQNAVELAAGELRDRALLASSTLEHLAAASAEKELLLNDASLSLHPIVSEREAQHGADSPFDMQLGLLIVLLTLMSLRFSQSLASRPMFAALMRERQESTIEVLLTAYSIEEIIFGRLLGAMLLCLVPAAIYLPLLIVLGVCCTPLPLGFFVSSIAFIFVETLLYSALYFLCGSFAKDQESASRLCMPLEMLWIAASCTLLYVIRVPDSSMAQTLCYVPLLSSSAIPVRIALSEGLPLLSYGFSFAMTLFLALFAARLNADLAQKAKESLLFGQSKSAHEVHRRRRK